MRCCKYVGEITAGSYAQVSETFTAQIVHWRAVQWLSTRSFIDIAVAWQLTRRAASMPVHLSPAQLLRIAAWTHRTLLAARCGWTIQQDRPLGLAPSNCARVGAVNHSFFHSSADPSSAADAVRRLSTERA